LINIGAINHDKQVKMRTYEQRYALDSPAGVKRLLRDYHALVSRQYTGDYDAVILLTDLWSAVESAKLTDRQRQALTLYFVEDLRMEDVGKRMGIRKHTASLYVKAALTKIAAVYERWAWLGEGYSVTRAHEWGEARVVSGEYGWVAVPVTIKHGKWRAVK
jgi:predicted DNA-binding protein (UPF0251 family)